MQKTGPSRRGWALLLLAIVTAAFLRFWQLGQIPPGLYRDEASNGLDALDVLAGRHSLYFAGNNGREPAYIYLTAVAVAMLGRSALAVRITAAISGTLTTWMTYKLAQAWFGWRVGLLSAWMWAITIWPIHLSRVGLRPILLPLSLALTLWLGTLAFRRAREGHVRAWLWLLAGICYGASFYTYLPARFTPLLLLVFALYLSATGWRKGLWPGLVWFGLGGLVTLTPLILLAWQQPDLVLGRPAQVSILGSAAGTADVAGTLWQQTWRSLGMFLVKGDTILRHNPSGRPVFDAFMAAPFLLGLILCIRKWRRPPAMLLLLWSGLVLGATILAEDAPHFLRATGVLPAVMMFPALGLSQLWTWTKLPSRSGQALVVLLPAFSLALGIRDYFFEYGRRPETAYWFEAAARDLAEDINNEPAGSRLYIDQRFPEGWSSVRFLLQPDLATRYFRPAEGVPEGIVPPAVVYAWPHESLEEVLGALSLPALTTGQTGSLAQGDLESEPYPLYVRYPVSLPVSWPVLANFGDKVQLRRADVTILERRQLQIDLFWSAAKELDRSYVTFVHVVDRQGSLGQDDSVPSQGNWPTVWWRPGLTILDRHELELQQAYEESEHDILIGLYDAETRLHLPVLDSDGVPEGNTWSLRS